MDLILIVDDLPVNRLILSEIFKEQYEVIEAADGEEAIAKLMEYRNELSVVFLDLIMPKKTGIDVLSFMNESGMINDIPVIMITGEATTESDIKSYEYGASDIIYKPFEPMIVMRRAKNIIELYKKKKSIEEQLAERTKELLDSREQLAKNNDFLLNALGNIVGYRSVESGEHIDRVKHITRILANNYKKLYPDCALNKEEIELISNASVLHDLGKLAIPDSILNKPGKFTKEEFDEMKKHSEYGCEILESFKQDDDHFYRTCYEICRWHHEKDDGKGYPDGLKGDEIPLSAKLVSVADCFDALVSQRIYKAAYEFETAIDMLVRGDCGKFADDLIEVLLFSKVELFAYVEGE